MKRSLLIALGIGGGLVGSATLAATSGLSDPTRPPAGIDQPADVENKPSTSGLQTIVRRHGAKPAAVINGEYVVLGGRVGDARLIRIGEDSVTLRGPGGTEVLKLAPGVDKAPAAKDPAGGGRR